MPLTEIFSANASLIAKWRPVFIDIDVYAPLRHTRKVNLPIGLCILNTRAERWSGRSGASCNRRLIGASSTSRFAVRNGYIDKDI